jgi:hypothetical protein
LGAQINNEDHFLFWKRGYLSRLAWWGKENIPKIIFKIFAF